MRLFERYRELQGETSSAGLYVDPTLAWPHYDANYDDLLAPLARDGRVLDVGCGTGSMLGWLRTRGFTNVRGVDISPGDVAFANDYLGATLVMEQDAVGHLIENVGKYDLVIAKAIVEHVPKEDLVALVDALAVGLRPGGRVVVEVPNMDWLLAPHERYMDLTHEVGFTRESLSTWLALRFDSVDVRGSALAAPTRAQRLLRRPLVALVRKLLYVLGEGASDTLFQHRSLIAVARFPRSGT